MIGQIPLVDIIRLLQHQPLTGLLQRQALTGLPMFLKYVSGQTPTKFVCLLQNNYLLLTAC